MPAYLRAGRGRSRSITPVYRILRGRSTTAQATDIAVAER
jgi:hypothetical protein